MTDSGPWTVLRLINWTKDYLARAGVEEPRLAAEMLLAKVLSCRRVALYTQFDRVVEGEHLAAYRQLVKQAAAHEPIAYLVGEKEFYSLSFKVTPDVLVPRPETELLVDAALEVARAAVGPVRHWDACTGSGCVAVAAANYAPNLLVLASDISVPALEVARINVERYGLGGRVTVAQADLLTPPPEAERLLPFDVLTVNPPYVSDAEMRHISETVKREPPLAVRAGPTGLEFISRIVQQAPPALRVGGTIALEFGFGQTPAVWRLFDQSGAYEEMKVLKDQAGIERVIAAKRKA